MIWKIWKYALGSFADDKTRDYDNVVAIVRTIILFTYLITNTKGKEWQKNQEK